MKIIVDELPKSCSQCMFGRGRIDIQVFLDRVNNEYKDSCNCFLLNDTCYGFNLRENRLLKCPLKSIKEEKEGN